MKRNVALLLLAAVSLTVAVGCGGDDAGNAAAEREIRSVVERIDQAVRDKDARGFCEIVLPSQVDQTFHSIGRCARETGEVLKASTEQPPLAVKEISVEGDAATVTLTEQGGELRFKREDGNWYLEMDQDEA